MNTASEIESNSNRLMVAKDCFAIDPQVATLNVITDHQRSHQLAYAHFIRSELGDNPALEQKSDAPPQLLSIHFSIGVVTVLGAGLRVLDRALQKNELKLVQRGKCTNERATTPTTTVITSVTITFNEGQA